MSPLGKLTLALIGFKLFGLDGLLSGLFWDICLLIKLMLSEVSRNK